MNAAIGKKNTREDHRSIADQIYAFYAEGRDLEKLVTIIGEGSLTEHDRKVLEFSKRFEAEYLNQGGENRTIQETLDLSWELLSDLPTGYLKRIPEEYIRKYRK
jgi:V/A-type H+/Na+-transporting ATPase subunit B